MGPAGPTISVIDDDESVRKALRRLIRSAGWDAETFASAEEFLAAAGRRTPVCLILDVRMGGMSGLELQQRLAASAQPIPIVFITAHEDEGARRAALEAGAVDFLQKPFDDRVLLDSVAKALAQPRGMFVEP
jgi:FixJ family two-component response regulator